MRPERWVIAILLCALVCSAAPLAQTGAETKRPTFAGAWRPSDPARSEEFFGIGIGWVTGDGWLNIEQTSNHLTVTTHLPDAKLDSYLAVQQTFHPTIIYAIFESPASGGRGYAAASGQGGSWQGERLILTQRVISNRRSSLSLLFDGDRLKAEHYSAIIGTDKEATTPEWFERIK